MYVLPAKYHLVQINIHYGRYHLKTLLIRYKTLRICTTDASPHYLPSIMNGLIMINGDVSSYNGDVLKVIVYDNNGDVEESKMDIELRCMM